MSTPSPDPLAGLDSIDWSQLTHAYGSAEDVPILLRQLQSTNPDEYTTAGDELLSTICHQGTRYSASVEAVPFLYSLLDHEATKSRGFLLHLITALAVGHPSWSVPHGIDVVKWQKRIAEIQAPVHRGPELDEFKAYEAVERGLDSVIQCLEDEPANIRAIAAHTLAFFPRQSEESTVALLDLYNRETNCAVRGTVVLAVAIMFAPLGPDSKKSEMIQQLRDYYEAARGVDGSDDLTRWSCATALVILGSAQKELVEETRRVVTDEAYLASLDESIGTDMDFPFATFSLRSLAESVLVGSKVSSLVDTDAS
ncbi:hypothetical protein AK830_g4361 [Neonectria ditissima]|uniref:Tubulin-specific chaperone D C-terminal domain-containing protein n=1 Tax=Neonectria ditissima TaxID=78410 RepID=A0A0P7BNL6_9HYPO|nr:hypothetical protein AK830_g4361 [Neonectria ditissima]